MLDLKTVLDSRLIFGRMFDASRPSKFDQKQRPRRSQSFNTWDHAYIQRCYTFYFGQELPDKISSLDMIVKTLRLIGMLAGQLRNSSVLEIVYKLLPTFQMPSCEIVASSSLAMDNWLLLVDYSVVLGSTICRYLQRKGKCSKTELEKFIELTITHTLSHVRKVITNFVALITIAFSYCPLTRCLNRCWQNARHFQFLRNCVQKFRRWSSGQFCNLDDNCYTFILDFYQSLSISYLFPFKTTMHSLICWVLQLSIFWPEPSQNCRSIWLFTSWIPNARRTDNVFSIFFV